MKPPVVALATGDSTVDRAMRGGAAAEGVGAAFLAGYRAALAQLVPSLAPDARACLCATEEGGAHPRAIHTRLVADGDAWRLDGRKKWVTAADLADVLLVVAAIGLDADGRNRLRLVRVDVHQPGVTLHPMPPTPFVPEIAHAEVELRAVVIAPDALLPGDGYDEYLKPFRTLEDIHVHAAVLSFVAAVAARAGWPEDAQQRLVAIQLATRALATLDPRAPSTHLALAGVIDLARRFLDDTRTSWDLVDAPTRQAWQRDAPLIDVAARARAARTRAAWERWRQA